MDFTSEALITVMPILESGARTGRSTDDQRCGIGIGDEGDPMFTLQSGKQHAVAFAENQRGEIRTSDVSMQLSCAGGKPGMGYPAVAINLRGREGGAMPECDEVASMRAASGGSSRSYIESQMAVRRLMPIECERLQGFPDDYTLIKHKNRWASDSARYRSLGNSMAVPVMRWIGERMEAVETIAEKTA
jgi:DNA (cytosine-5)-methyltransferase 1